MGHPSKCAFDSRGEAKGRGRAAKKGIWEKNSRNPKGAGQGMKASYFSKDVQDFLKLLTDHDVKYLIVGGEAVIYYGHARLTGDIDFFYQPTKKNAAKLYRALDEFWGGDIPGISALEELVEPGIILQFGVPPNRIDLLNRISGITFQEAWKGKKTISIEIGGAKFPIFLIGLKELIKNKEAIRRPKDLEDLKYLKRQKGEV
jgi:predicted nucleotidyltransferase